MSKKFTKVLALFLTVLIASSSMLVFASANEKQGQVTNHSHVCVDGNCPYTPTIIIHGIGQSLVRVKDNSGNYIKDDSGNDIKTFPPSVDVGSIIKTVLFPALTSLILQSDRGLSTAVAGAVADAFKYSETDLEGNPVHNVEVEKYEASLADLPQAEKNFVYSQLPLGDFTDVAGESHTFYFAYDSFGNILDIAAELAEFIQMVLDTTGHDKVNLVPISLGGAVATAFIDNYKELYSKIEKLVFIIPAADGAQIVSDIFKGEFNYADEMLYSQMLPSLVEGYQGYLLNLLIRILPKDVLIKTLSTTVDSIIDLLKTCTNFWALVPSGEYEALANDILAGEEYAYLKARTDKYYQAQLNREDNITEMQAAGVQVFDIVDYNVPAYNVTTSWDKFNSDGIIHVDSTSFNAYSLPLGHSFPQDYVQQNTFCTDPSHNHISPYRNLDASTGLLCETTWYVNGQHHEGTGRDDIVMSLAFEILLYDDIKDVHSDPRYPQFMDGRESRHLRMTLLNQAYVAKATMDLSPEVLTRLNAAIDDANLLLSRGTDSYERFLEVESNLEKVLVEIGVRQESKQESLMDKVLYTFFKTLSDAVYRLTGAAGYQDMLPNRR